MNAITLEILVILLLLVANGVFAMTEMAIVSSRKSRLRLLADGGNRGALAALKLAEDPNRFLPAVQVGITLMGLLAGAFGGATIVEEIARRLLPFPAVAPYAEAIGVGTVVLTMTFFALVIGELVPKRLALASPEFIASLMARPLDGLSRAARPAIWLLSRSTDAVLALLRVRPQPREVISEEEVKLLMNEGSQAGVFHPDEPRMVESVLAFDHRPVTAIMTPRNKVIFIRKDEKPDMLWHKIVVSGHNHYPVHDGIRDHVVGVISVKAVYANSGASVPPVVGDLMVEPLIIPAKLSVASLLERFKQTGRHMGIVTDERNICLGVVTLVDVLEAIVGELPSIEERLRPEARQRDDGSWLVDGSFEMAKLWQQLNAEAPATPGFTGRQTIGMFVRSRLNGGMAEGRSFSDTGWAFEILDMDGERVDKVLITPQSKELGGKSCETKN